MILIKDFFYEEIECKVGEEATLKKETETTFSIGNDKRKDYFYIRSCVNIHFMNVYDDGEKFYITIDVDETFIIPHNSAGFVSGETIHIFNGTIDTQYGCIILSTISETLVRPVYCLNHNGVPLNHGRVPILRKRNGRYLPWEMMIDDDMEVDVKIPSLVLVMMRNKNY